MSPKNVFVVLASTSLALGCAVQPQEAAAPGGDGANANANVEHTASESSAYTAYPAYPGYPTPNYPNYPSPTYPSYPVTSAPYSDLTNGYAYAPVLNSTYPAGVCDTVAYPITAQQFARGPILRVTIPQECGAANFSNVIAYGANVYGQTVPITIAPLGGQYVNGAQELFYNVNNGYGATIRSIGWNAYYPSACGVTFSVASPYLESALDNEVCQEAEALLEQNYGSYLNSCAYLPRSGRCALELAFQDQGALNYYFQRRAQLGQRWDTLAFFSNALQQPVSIPLFPTAFSPYDAQ